MVSKFFILVFVSWTQHISQEKKNLFFINNIMDLCAQIIVIVW